MATVCLTSNGGPLDDVAADAPPAPAVDLRGAGMGVAGQVLDVLKRHVLVHEVRDCQDTERVRVGCRPLRTGNRRATATTADRVDER